VLSTGAAAWRYGPGAWGQLTAMRFEARGAKLAARGDAEAAVEAYGRALEAAPDRLDLRSQRAAVNVSLHRFDSALADIDAALRLAPEFILLYKQRAEIDRQRNDPKAAIADLDTALLHKPNDPELLAMRAQAKLDAQDSQSAYRDLDAASRAAPDNAIVRRTFAAWDVDAGDLDAALRDLNARLYADPKDAVAYFQRGRVWLYKGDPARAAADLARADVDAAFLYPALWRFLARARAREDGAAELLTRLAKAPNKWPSPVARMFVGLIDPAAARDAAGNADERCEADFYQVAWRRAREDHAAGADEWRTVMQRCPTAFIEYEGAKVEWRRAAR
jgi:tetratricopeptide (TPR) repeat protein